MYAKYKNVYQSVKEDTLYPFSSDGHLYATDAFHVIITMTLTYKQIT